MNHRISFGIFLTTKKNTSSLDVDQYGRLVVTLKIKHASTLHTAHREFEGLIEDRVQGFPVNFGFELLLVVRKQVDADVRVRKSVKVHGGEVLLILDLTA